MQTWFLFALLSAVFAAATAILAKVGIKGVDPDLATAVRTIVILIFAWGIALARGKAGGLAALSPKCIAFLVLSGIATGASWLCYYRALKLGPASLVAPIDKMSVVLVAVFGVVLLGEKLTLLHTLGVVMIAGGAILVAL